MALSTSLTCETLSEAETGEARNIIEIAVFVVLGSFFFFFGGGGLFFVSFFLTLLVLKMASGYVKLRAKVASCNRIAVGKKHTTLRTGGEEKYQKK